MYHPQRYDNILFLRSTEVIRNTTEILSRQKLPVIYINTRYFELFAEKLVTSQVLSRLRETSEHHSQGRKFSINVISQRNRIANGPTQMWPIRFLWVWRISVKHLRTKVHTYFVHTTWGTTASYQVQYDLVGSASLFSTLRISINSYRQSLSYHIHSIHANKVLKNHIKMAKDCGGCELFHKQKSRRKHQEIWKK